MKKRKSSIGQNEPKAKSPKKDMSTDGPSPKNVKPKPIKTQMPKAKTPAKSKNPVKAVGAGVALGAKTKLTPPMKKTTKSNLNENAEQTQSKFEKRTPAKNLLKKNIKPKTPKPKVIQTEKSVEEPEESSDAEISDDEEQEEPVITQAKNKNAVKQVATKGKRNTNKRTSMKEKFAELRKKVEKGDKAAIKEVEEVIKKIEDRGELSRTSKRKLRAYRSILGGAKGKPAAAEKTPKTKKGAKKNQ